MGDRVLVVRIDPLAVGERLRWIRGTSEDTVVSVMAAAGNSPETGDVSRLIDFAYDGEMEAFTADGGLSGAKKDWITTQEPSSISGLWYLSAVRKTDAYRLSNLSVRVASVLLALAVTVSALLVIWNIRRNIAPLERIAARLSRGSETKGNEIRVINEAIEDLLGELDLLNSRLAEQQNAQEAEAAESGAGGPEEEGARHEIAGKVWQIIETQYTKPELDLSSVAEQAGYSPRYISMIFKQEYGSGVAEYISFVRIQKAKELIAESDMSIKAVAAEVGFAGDVQFIRAFKRMEGITPGSYRSSLFS
jgi:AraC-like DNA-binding protein